MHPFPSIDPIRLAPLMLVVASIGIHPTHAQSDLGFEPYPVFVAHEEAYARCGPAGDYYRTDPLRHGQELEVYAETEDGWLGIRPPDDSFCWIPAETIELDSKGETGTVIEDRTVAWIGTHLGRARTYRWQVQLAEGEPVTVVGRSEREGPDGPQLWLRIVPPSGEYRWVHRDQVVMSSEELVATIRPPSNGDDIILIPENQPTTPRRAQTASVQSSAPRSASAKNRGSQTDSSPASSRRNSPKPRSMASSGPSILEQADGQAETVGSGLSDNWNANDMRQSTETATQAGGETSVPAANTTAAADSSNQPKTINEAMKRGGLLASVEFLSRPRLSEINGAPSAPSANEQPSDGNWVAGFSRRRAEAIARESSPSPETPFVVASQAGPNASGTIMQASALQPIAVASLSSPVATGTTTRTIVVPAERIAQIESETSGADMERLSLIFSRLMAAQATAAETEPVERAARQLASSMTDPVTAGRARLLAERAEQYRRLANRRDGEAVIGSHLTPFIAPATAIPASAAMSIVQPGMTQTGAVAQASYGEPSVETSTQTGYLVQVYSARTNSPPFALTDNTGRTLAYVTPSPGVNLRNHLNSKVSVFGSQAFLTGLNTPHILATQAVRTPE